MAKTDGYQGISFELAKALLAQAEKAAATNKGPLVRDAMAILSEMTRTPSGYQQEAIKLRRDKLGSRRSRLLRRGDRRGRRPLAEKKWDEAVRAYELALKFADKLSGRKKKQLEPRIKAVRETIAQIKLLLARQLFRDNKLPECLEALKAV